jgi:hypothetical protein
MQDVQMTRTYLYGPAVCCKPDVSDGGIGLAHLYPAMSRALVLLAIMDIRAHPSSLPAMPRMVETLNNHYFVSVSRFGKPSRWQWEIQRRPKPLGVKLCEAGFKSESAAKLAGEKVLRKLLDGIADERIAGAHLGVSVTKRQIF